MNGIPKAKVRDKKRITPNNVQDKKLKEKVLFSFESLVKNEYFNLDGTCQNWASDLFDTM